MHLTDTIELQGTKKFDTLERLEGIKLEWYETKCGMIENRVGTPMFYTALSQMFTIGIREASGLSDKEIADIAMDEHDYTTTEFAQEIFRVAREIANLRLWDDIMPYIKDYMNFQSNENYKKRAEMYKSIAQSVIENHSNYEQVAQELGYKTEEFEKIMFA